MSVDNPKSKMVVIDTTSYAGNFERQLCAYVSGQYGECGVGDDIAEEAIREIAHAEWWSHHIAMEPDDRNCSRPASIWPTPGWFNNGNGGHYRDDPSNHAQARADAVASMREWHAAHERPIRERLAKRDFEPADKPGAWTEEACLRTLQANEASIQRVAESQHRYPAYLSVAIFVDELPPEDVLEEMKLRAAHFCDNYKSFVRYSSIERIEITGFRLLDRQLDDRKTPAP